MRILRTKICANCYVKLEFGDFNCKCCNEPTPLLNRDETYVSAALLAVSQTIIIFTLLN